MIARSLPIAIAGVAIWLWVELRPVQHPPGVLIAHPPATLRVSPIPLPSREGAGEFLLSRVARVHAQGRVLAIERYRDEAAPLAPIDIVIGWGEMSDSQIIRQITISQEARRHTLTWRGAPPFDLRKAFGLTVNLHLVPGTPEMDAFISSIKPGMLVDLRGALAEATQGERRWATSLAHRPAASPSDQARELPPELSGSRLLFVTEGTALQGRSQQDLRARALRDHAAQETADLQLWFEALKRRRESLDVENAIAVREFNREAARYMSIAHPSRRTTAPAALRNPAGAPSSPR